MEHSRLLMQDEARHPQDTIEPRASDVETRSHERVVDSGKHQRKYPLEGRDLLERRTASHTDGSSLDPLEDLATLNIPRDNYLAQFSRPTSSQSNLSSGIDDADANASARTLTHMEERKPQFQNWQFAVSDQQSRSALVPAIAGTSESSGPARTASTDAAESLTCANSPRLGKPSRTAVGEYPVNTQSGKPVQYWNSVWLRNRTLFALATLFASLAAALMVLWFTNKARHGFAPTIWNNHYAWTYGPTAVLVVVLSFWRQVDYHCKMIQPWQELCKGCYVDAERSLLLDYLSPTHVVSLIRAARNRHIPVVASITGFITLKIVVLVSTGLLVLTPVTITEQYPVTLIDVFDGAHFWEHIIPNSYGAPHVSGYELTDSTSSPYLNVSKIPVHTFLRSLEDDNIQASGMTENIVFQSFTPATASALQDVSVEVDAFVPNASCEIAEPTWWLDPHFSIRVNLESETCSIGNWSYLELDLSWQPYVDYVLSNPFSRNIWRVNCSRTGADRGRTALDVNTPYDFRYAILVSNISNIGASNFTTDATFRQDNKSQKVVVPDQTAAVICSLDYSMYRYTVTRDLHDTVVAMRQMSSGSDLKNLTALMLSERIYATFLATENIESTTIFSVLSHYLDKQQPGDSLLIDPQALQLASSQVWAGIGAQIVREGYLTPAHTPANGTATIYKDRLCIGIASLSIMVIGLLLLIALTIVIMLTRSQNIVPWDPWLISTDAIVQARSAESFAHIRNCGKMRTSEITDWLRGFKFGMSVNEAFRLTSIYNCPDPASKAFRKAKAKSWSPPSAKSLMIGLTLAAPVAVILVLEILYHISVIHDGFRDVTGLEDIASYFSRYVSALVVLLIVTCFNNLDFTTASFAPYSVLRSGAVPARRALNFQLLGTLPPVALFRSLQYREIASFCSNMAGTIGSLLTIIASGLWVVDRAIITEHTVAASLSSQWDISWPNSSVVNGDGMIANDGGAGDRFNGLQYGSLRMPDSIWNGIVFPSISAVDLSPDATSAPDPGQLLSEQNQTFQYAGLRPLLRCEVVEDEYILINFTQIQLSKYELQDALDVQATPKLPLSCQHAGSNGTRDHYKFSSRHALPDADDMRFMGNFWDLHLGPWVMDGFSQDYGEAHHFHVPDNPAGCPSIGAIFAKNSREQVGKDDVTAILCSQMIQQVQVNVTSSGPGFAKLGSAHRVIESSTRNLTNGTDGIDTFPYRVQAYLEEKTSIYNYTFGSLSLFESQNTTFDAFMNHLLFAPNGTAAQDLAGKANRQNFIQAVNDMYARYMCLVIDMRFRQPIPEQLRAKGPGDEGYLEGTAQSFSSRLRVDRASKLTMQIMLAVMFVLGAFTYALTDLRGTLPRKPTSIASRLALLAGSDLCDPQKSHIPYNAMWMSKKELDKVFDGYFIGLGWWQQADTGADDHAEETATGESAASGKEDDQRRFGIDVGIPEQLGFRETKWWTLRRRLRRRAE